MIVTPVNPARLSLANLFRQVLPVGIAISILSAAAIAQATTIATWTFETSQPSVTGAAAGPYPSEIGTGSASGSHASSATVYSTPAGDGSSHSFSSNTWAAGDYYQFQVNTTGQQQIDLDWDQTSSNTGPRDFNLEYSTDGTHFTTFTSSYGSPYEVLANVAPNAWNATTFSNTFEFNVDLSSVTAINDAASVDFRLVDADTISANGGTVATAGTDRVNNFTVTSSPVSVPEPSTVFLAALALSGLGLFSVCRRSA